MMILLKNRTLLKLSGGDAQSFLQGQLSNDIDALDFKTAQLNAYCQHQGKIIALLWVMRVDGGFYVSLPRDLADVVVQKLNMFKMMADVSIQDVSDEFVQLGVINAPFDGAFSLNSAQSVAILDALPEADLADETAWEAACIAHHLPEVVLKTSEQFVPQLLNLDIDEVGVNFSKGCYPGQEVVARLHYLGKSKRRMRRFEVDEAVAVGDYVIAVQSKSAKASGVVVRCVKLFDKYSLLASVEVAYQDDKLTLNTLGGAPLIRITDD